MDIIFGIFVCVFFLLSTSGSSLADVLPEPRNVHFSSINLRNLVKWTPGDSSDNDTIRYTVQYAIYGVAKPGTSKLRWRNVSGCMSLAYTECDISEETHDLMDDYYARVRASQNLRERVSAWSSTLKRFMPKSDMILGAPSVDVTVRENYIIASIEGPFRWKTKKSMNDESFFEIFPDLYYNVSVFDNKKNHTVRFWLNNGSLTHGPLLFSSQYCVVAQAHSKHLPFEGLPSQLRCVTTSPDVFKDHLIGALLGGVLPSALCLCVLLVLGGLIHRYITDHKQKLPTCTHIVQKNEKLQTFLPETSQTIVINLIKPGCLEDEASLPWFNLQHKTEPLKAVSYTHQNWHVPQNDTIQDFTDSEPVDVPSYAQQQPEHASLGSYAEQQGALMICQDESSESLQSLQNDAADYGIVMQVDSEALYQGEAQLSVYRTQDSQDEEPTQIFLDWSPGTEGLKIPLISLEKENPEGPMLLIPSSEGSVLLPNLILRQSSKESVEDDFSRMEKDWGLVIHSNPE